MAIVTTPLHKEEIQMFPKWLTYLCLLVGFCFMYRLLLVGLVARIIYYMAYPEEKKEVGYYRVEIQRTTPFLLYC